MLLQKNWSKTTYETLSDLIERRKSDAATPKYERNYVVTDWDDTSALFDMEDATFLYQLFHLDFHMTTEEFSYVITKDITVAADSFGEYLVKDIIFRYPIVMQQKQTAYDQEWKTSSDYQTFVAQMAYFYRLTEPSIQKNMRGGNDMYLFYNMTESELRNFAQNTLSYWTKEPLTTKTFSFVLNGIQKSCSYRTGLRAIPEQVNLFQTLRENYIDVYVCTATNQILIEEFGCSPEFGYEFKQGEITGFRLKQNDSAQFLAEVDSSQIETISQGKADYIQTLEQLYHKAPILYMGDNNGDYEALTYPNLEVGIIFDLPRKGKINELKQIAINQTPSDTLYLIQERESILKELEQK